MGTKHSTHLNWTKDRIAQLKLWLKEGKTQKEIGNLLGVLKWSVDSAIKRHRLERPENQYWEGVKTRERILDRLQIGPAKNKELRNLTGVGTSQIHRILKDMIKAKLVRRERYGYYGMVPRKKRED